MGTIRFDHIKDVSFGAVFGDAQQASGEPREGTIKINHNTFTVRLVPIDAEDNGNHFRVEADFHHDTKFTWLKGKTLQRVQAKLDEEFQNWMDARLRTNDAQSPATVMEEPDAGAGLLVGDNGRSDGESVQPSESEVVEEPVPPPESEAVGEPVPPTESEVVEAPVPPPESEAVGEPVPLQIKTQGLLSAICEGKVEHDKTAQEEIDALSKKFTGFTARLECYGVDNVTVSSLYGKVLPNIRKDSKLGVFRHEFDILGEIGRYVDAAKDGAVSVKPGWIGKVEQKNGDGKPDIGKTLSALVRENLRDGVVTFRNRAIKLDGAKLDALGSDCMDALGTALLELSKDSLFALDRETIRTIVSTRLSAAAERLDEESRGAFRELAPCLLNVVFERLATRMIDGVEILENLEKNFMSAEEVRLKWWSDLDFTVDDLVRPKDFAKVRESLEELGADGLVNDAWVGRACCRLPLEEELRKIPATCPTETLEDFQDIRPSDCDFTWEDWDDADWFASLTDEEYNKLSPEYQAHYRELYFDVVEAYKSVKQKRTWSNWLTLQKEKAAREKAAGKVDEKRQFDRCLTQAAFLKSVHEMGRMGVVAGDREARFRKSAASALPVKASEETIIDVNSNGVWEPAEDSSTSRRIVSGSFNGVFDIPDDPDDNPWFDPHAKKLWEQRNLQVLDFTRRLGFEKVGDYSLSSLYQTILPKVFESVGDHAGSMKTVDPNTPESYRRFLYEARNELDILGEIGRYARSAAIGKSFSPPDWIGKVEKRGDGNRPDIGKTMKALVRENLRDAYLKGCWLIDDDRLNGFGDVCFEAIGAALLDMANNPSLDRSYNSVKILVQSHLPPAMDEQDMHDRSDFLKLAPKLLDLVVDRIAGNVMEGIRLTAEFEAKLENTNRKILGKIRDEDDFSESDFVTEKDLETLFETLGKIDARGLLNGALLEHIFHNLPEQAHYHCIYDEPDKLRLLTKERFLEFCGFQHHPCGFLDVDPVPEDVTESFDRDERVCKLLYWRGEYAKVKNGDGKDSREYRECFQQYTDYLAKFEAAYADKFQKESIAIQLDVDGIEKELAPVKNAIRDISRLIELKTERRHLEVEKSYEKRHADRTMRDKREDLERDLSKWKTDALHKMLKKGFEYDGKEAYSEVRKLDGQIGSVNGDIAAVKGRLDPELRSQVNKYSKISKKFGDDDWEWESKQLEGLLESLKNKRERIEGRLAKARGVLKKRRATREVEEARIKALKNPNGQELEDLLKNNRSAVKIDTSTILWGGSAKDDSGLRLSVESKRVAPVLSSLNKSLGVQMSDKTTAKDIYDRYVYRLQDLPAAKERNDDSGEASQLLDFIRKNWRHLDVLAEFSVQAGRSPTKANASIRAALPSALKTGAGAFCMFSNEHIDILRKALVTLSGDATRFSLTDESLRAAVERFLPSVTSEADKALLEQSPHLLNAVIRRMFEVKMQTLSAFCFSSPLRLDALDEEVEAFAERHFAQQVCDRWGIQPSHAVCDAILRYFGEELPEDLGPWPTVLERNLSNVDATLPIRDFVIRTMVEKLPLRETPKWLHVDKPNELVNTVLSSEEVDQILKNLLLQHCPEELKKDGGLTDARWNLLGSAFAKMVASVKSRPGVADFVRSVREAMPSEEVQRDDGKAFLELSAKIYSSVVCALSLVDFEGQISAPPRATPALSLEELPETYADWQKLMEERGIDIAELSELWGGDPLSGKKPELSGNLNAFISEVDSKTNFYSDDVLNSPKFDAQTLATYTTYEGRGDYDSPNVDTEGAVRSMVGDYFTKFDPRQMVDQAIRNDNSYGDNKLEQQTDCMKLRNWLDRIKDPEAVIWEEEPVGEKTLEDFAVKEMPTSIDCADPLKEGTMRKCLIAAAVDPAFRAQLQEGRVFKTSGTYLTIGGRPVTQRILLPNYEALARGQNSAGQDAFLHLLEESANNEADPVKKLEMKGLLSRVEGDFSGTGATGKNDFAVCTGEDAAVFRTFRKVSEGCEVECVVTARDYIEALSAGPSGKLYKELCSSEFASKSFVQRLKADMDEVMLHRQLTQERRVHQLRMDWQQKLRENVERLDVFAMIRSYDAIAAAAKSGNGAPPEKETGWKAMAAQKGIEETMDAIVRKNLPHVEASEETDKFSLKNLKETDFFAKTRIRILGNALLDIARLDAEGELDEETIRRDIIEYWIDAEVEKRDQKDRTAEDKAFAHTALSLLNAIVKRMYNRQESKLYFDFCKERKIPGPFEEINKMLKKGKSVDGDDHWWMDDSNGGVYNHKGVTVESSLLRHAQKMQTSEQAIDVDLLARQIDKTYSDGNSLVELSAGLEDIGGPVDCTSVKVRVELISHPDAGRVMVKSEDHDIPPCPELSKRSIKEHRTACLAWAAVDPVYRARLRDLKGAFETNAVPSRPCLTFGSYPTTRVPLDTYLGAIMEPDGENGKKYRAVKNALELARSNVSTNIEALAKNAAKDDAGDVAAQKRRLEGDLAKIDALMNGLAEDLKKTNELSSPEEWTAFQGAVSDRFSHGTSEDYFLVDLPSGSRDEMGIVQGVTVGECLDALAAGSNSLIHGRCSYNLNRADASWAGDNFRSATGMVESLSGYSNAIAWRNRLRDNSGKLDVFGKIRGYGRIAREGLPAGQGKATGWSAMVVRQGIEATMSALVRQNLPDIKELTDGGWFSDEHVKILGGALLDVAELAEKEPVTEERIRTIIKNRQANVSMPDNVQEAFEALAPKLLDVVVDQMYSRQEAKLYFDFCRERKIPRTFEWVAAEKGDAGQTGMSVQSSVMRPVVKVESKEPNPEAADSPDLFGGADEMRFLG